MAYQLIWVANKPTKFYENRKTHFFENLNFKFFLSELPLILRVGRENKNGQEIFARELKISDLNEIGQ